MLSSQIKLLVSFSTSANVYIMNGHIDIGSLLLYEPGELQGCHTANP
jgi:hypothetical protein